MLRIFTILGILRVKREQRELEKILFCEGIREVWSLQRVGGRKCKEIVRNTPNVSFSRQGFNKKKLQNTPKGYNSRWVRCTSMLNRVVLVLKQTCGSKSLGLGTAQPKCRAEPAQAHFTGVPCTAGTEYRAGPDICRRGHLTHLSHIRVNFNESCQASRLI